MFTRALSLPPQHRPAWTPPYLDSSLRAQGNRQHASQWTPHPTPHSRAGTQALVQQTTSTTRAGCGLASGPGAGPGPQRARGTPVRRGPGQPGSGHQTAWPQAQERVTRQHSHVKATKSCVVCTAVPAAAATWDSTQGRPSRGAQGPPERLPLVARSCTNGEGMDTHRSSRGSWPLMTPLRAASSGPSPPCPAAQAQLQSGGGKGRRDPRDGQGSHVGSCRSHCHEVHRGCGSPESGNNHTQVPREGRATLSRTPRGDSGSPGRDPSSSRLGPVASLWAGICCPPSCPHASPSRDHSLCRGLN